MSAQTELTMAPLPSSIDERRALRALRTRYRQTGDQFTAMELARLRFWRWLYRTGRFIP